MSRYRLLCDGQCLAMLDSADAIQRFAQAHAGEWERLNWIYDPTRPAETTASAAGRLYTIEIVAWEQRRR